jgi:hypothetical protein
MSSPRQGSGAGLYVTIQDLRDEGIPETELGDDRALILLEGWQQWIERKTEQWFIPKDLEMYLDGNGSRVLWLPVPIISVTSLYANDDFDTAVDSDSYVVYNRYFPDDRRNPRIKLKRSTGNIYTSITTGKFVAGDQNQMIDGRFGFIEEDGTVPYAIRRAIMLLVNMTKEEMGDEEISALDRGRVIEEVTDRHRIKYADIWNSIRSWNSIGITEVDQAIKLYRRVINVRKARSFV